MPRTYVEEDGEMMPHDFCNRCWREAGFDDEDADEHPSYADEEYDCDRCGRRLTAADD